LFEYRSQVYVHGTDFEALYKVVPRKLLPEEYGGEAGPIQSKFDPTSKNFQNKNPHFPPLGIIEAMEKQLVDNRDFFIEDENYGVDEKKRVGRPKNSESLFGLEGSFRQLVID
jgi:hypothetical protein